MSGLGPGPLEDYATHFDPLFHSLAQRHHFRTYLAGLLAPRDRPKTLTALAGAEPLVQAQAAPVQQLQFFLSESCWDADRITMRTLQLLGEDPLTASDAGGVLVIDDTGDRKDGYVMLRALTGFGQAHDRVLSKAAGFDYHFVKPIDTHHLANIFTQLTY